MFRHLLVWAFCFCFTACLQLSTKIPQETFNKAPDPVIHMTFFVPENQMEQFYHDSYIAANIYDDAGIQLKIDHVYILREWFFESLEHLPERDYYNTLHQIESRSLVVFYRPLVKNPRNSEETFAGLQASHGSHSILFISKENRSDTLAHEIGHALTLNHVGDTENIMCSCDRSRNSVFNEAQKQHMRNMAILRYQYIYSGIQDPYMSL